MSRVVLPPDKRTRYGQSWSSEKVMASAWRMRMEEEVVKAGCVSTSTENSGGGRAEESDGETVMYGTERETGR